jgi:hypothetical protein
MEFTSMALRPSPVRLAFLVFGLVAGPAALGASALAEEQNPVVCSKDFASLAKNRDVELDRVNNLVRAAKGKRLDPAKFCSLAAGLRSAESALIAYMEKNKDSCGVPDEVVRSLKANSERELAFHRKLCGD